MIPPINKTYQNMAQFHQNINQAQTIKIKAQSHIFLNNNNNNKKTNLMTNFMK